MKRTRPKIEGIVKREMRWAWSGRTEVDYVCRKCLAVVPDLAKGCQHCVKREAVREARKQEWLDGLRRKREEVEAVG